ncbi:hypothetical protein NMG60_11034208 [Bertholletia excelsa]
MVDPRLLRSNSAAKLDPTSSTPSPEQQSAATRKSPRLCISGSPNSPVNARSSSGLGKESGSILGRKRESLVNKFSDCVIEKPKWNPKDVEQLLAVKNALHVSSVPSLVVCRVDEQKKVLEFCKQCIELEKAGSLYICGCPGTGKSPFMERIKSALFDWAKEVAINCTSLSNTSEIFSKILGKNQLRKKTNGPTSPLQQLQGLYSRKQQPTGMKMMLIIADELDYLITRDRAVLHDLFMLTTLPFSRCMLIGIANAIDLADRFLPKLQSLNCKPVVITFRAYSKDQIIVIQQRLKELPYTVFQPQALELCARKVAAASGDMRKTLCFCRSAIEIVETELRESSHDLNSSSAENGYSDQQKPGTCDSTKQEINIVRVDHMAIALSKTYSSPIVDTIQSLPQHQQIILCSIVKLFRRGKKDTTIGELNKSYLDICKLILIPPVGVMELSSMCRVLGDQVSYICCVLIKLSSSHCFALYSVREDKLRRVTLKSRRSGHCFCITGTPNLRNVVGRMLG